MNLDILKAWLEAKLVRDEKGASMVEYGLLVALIAVVAIIAVRFLGTSVSENFSEVGSAIGN
jgi:pilus assembly protein Flp/PilA